MFSVDIEALATLIDKKVREAVRDELSRLPQGPEYLTVSEAAALVSTSPSTIGAWFRDRKLARYGKGRAVRVKRSELLALMDSERERGDAKTADEVKAITQRLLKKGAH